MTIEMAMHTAHVAVALLQLVLIIQLISVGRHMRKALASVKGGAQ